MTFKKYANYYDSIYKDKDYQKEVDFLLKVIKRYSSIKIKDILNLGCGTANHDIILAERGFNILGIDASKRMIEIAREKAQNYPNINFKVSDLRKFALSKKFDLAMALFNVAGYLVENKDMEYFLKNIHRSLKEKALLVFDCWYGPAVLKNRPENKEKIFGRGLIRKTTQHLDIEKSIIDINFEIFKNGKNVAQENHKMRFWFLKEIEYFLQKNGFKLVRVCNFLDLDSQISENDWNIFIIAKKI